MSKGPIQITNPNAISDKSVILVPSQLNFAELQDLAETLKDRKVIWLVEETAQIGAKAQALIESHGGEGIAFSRNDTSPSGVGTVITEKLGSNGVAFFLPGFALSRQGNTIDTTGETLNFLGNLGLDIQPISVHRPADTVLKVCADKSEPRAIINVCDVIHRSKTNAASIRQSLLTANEASFSSRSFLNGSLAVSLIKGLKKHSSSHALFDGSDDSELKFGRILAAAIALSKEIRHETKQERVGIILPPGKAGMVANLAVLFADKIPVNLNFTSSHDAVHSAIKQSGVDRFITADPFVRKVPNFPWPVNRELIFIERILPQVKKKIVRWLFLSKILPTSLLAKMIGVGKRGGNDEAVLLFTSGSSGEPKGVALSHRNILANVCQFTTPLQLGSSDSILGALPLFHSFGSTVTLWYPLLEGVNLVTYPSPLETKRLAELIDKHSVSLMISTPTFLRGYMRRVDPEQLSSLKLVITGAEKLPESLARSFEKKFGILPLEGYGLTETSPATNLNLPEPASNGDSPVLASRRFGSAGQMLPGIAVKVTNSVTEKDQAINESGIIWLKGPNVFQGYLDRDDLSKDVLIDGWLCTGDVGRIDDDGFLFIEGRISRFSKIAGEMVPHETVEATVTKVMGLDQEDERKVAIVGVPDPKKGEALVLLSTVAGITLEQECIDLRYKLLDASIPSLWCPREIIPVKEIPVLASGKLDIKGCENLVAKNSGS